MYIPFGTSAQNDTCTMDLINSDLEHIAAAAITSRVNPYGCTCKICISFIHLSTYPSFCIYIVASQFTHRAIIFKKDTYRFVRIELELAAAAITSKLMDVSALYVFIYTPINLSVYLYI